MKKSKSLPKYKLVDEFEDAVSMLENHKWAESELSSIDADPPAKEKELAKAKTKLVLSIARERAQNKKLRVQLKALQKLYADEQSRGHTRF